MGTTEEERNDIDVIVMKEGPQLNNEQRETLIWPITEKEVMDALHSIDNTKSPGVDGFGAYFYKKA